MSGKLFVGGLPWAIDDARLREVFEQFGEISEAIVITDRATGRSRGFGFVTFANPEDAESARSLDGQDLDGRPMRVDSANERPSGGGGGGGGGGGRSDRW